MKQVATKEFGSGKYKQILSLHIDEEDNSGYIEQVTEGYDNIFDIGLWFEGKRVVGYDGVFVLSKEAIQLLQENGFITDDVE